MEELQKHLVEALNRCTDNGMKSALSCLCRQRKRQHAVDAVQQGTRTRYFGATRQGMVSSRRRSTSWW